MKKSSVVGIIFYLIFDTFCLAGGTIYDISLMTDSQDSCVLMLKYFGELYPYVQSNSREDLTLVIEHCSGFSQAPPISLRSHPYIKKIQWQAITDVFEISIIFKKTSDFRILMNRTEITIHLWPVQDKSVAKQNSAIYYKNQNSGYMACFMPVTIFIQQNKNLSDTSVCPVRLDDLTFMEITIWGMDDSVHQGSLIVHRQLAFEVMEIFEELYQNKFPIKQMRLIDEFDGQDNPSMAANNTSAFNCRSSTGNQNHLSLHAFGMAVDINPLFNPYVNGSTLLPQEGKKYKNRSLKIKGMIRKGDACHRAFTKHGWTWGGSWSHIKDYQHFEKQVK